jgi:hypothetical protein
VNYGEIGSIVETGPQSGSLALKKRNALSPLGGKGSRRKPPGPRRALSRPRFDDGPCSIVKKTPEGTNERSLGAVIVGDKTKDLFKFVRCEIELAIDAVSRSSLFI